MSVIGGWREELKVKGSSRSSNVVTFFARRHALRTSSRSSPVVTSVGRPPVFRVASGVQSRGSALRELHARFAEDLHDFRTFSETRLVYAGNIAGSLDASATACAPPLITRI